MWTTGGARRHDEERTYRGQARAMARILLSLGQARRRRLVEAVGELLEDQKRDRIATKIPFSGSIKDPKAGVWSTVGGLLRNAFIEALRRGLEGSIGLGGGKPTREGESKRDD
jgi:hypothetical protein